MALRMIYFSTTAINTVIVPHSRLFLSDISVDVNVDGGSTRKAKDGCIRLSCRKVWQKNE